MAILMENQRLGKTGHIVTVITLGGCGLGHLAQDEADKAVEIALKYGLNIVDVAPSYGEAEARLKPWVQKFRNRFFIAEKTLKRNKKEAWEELNHSLERLGVKNFDLYQLHAVDNLEELNLIFSKEGAIEAFKEARETGLIKYIGITGHSDVRVHMKALEMFDFDTILLPVNLAIMTSPSPENDFRPALRMALDNDIGVIVIKALAKGRWKEQRRYGTWYEPLDIQREIDMAVWFALSQEGVTTCTLPCDVNLWPMVLDAAERFRKLSQEEQKELVEYARKRGFKPLFPE